MRAVLWVGGVIVAFAAVVGASYLWAESKEKKAVPQARIAFFNLTYVIKNYDKYKQFQIEIKEYVEPYKKRDAQLREQLKELQSQAEKPSVVPTKGEDLTEKEKKEELEEKAKKVRQELEDISAKVKKELAKRSDPEMKSIYLDVAEAARRYATANGIDLVLQYNDSVTQHDLLSVENIKRKVTIGAFIPVYWNENMDISLDIVAMLNQKSRKK